MQPACVGGYNKYGSSKFKIKINLYSGICYNCTSVTAYIDIKAQDSYRCS
jgi:hypothetical protein